MGLDVVELVMRIEEEFEIEIPDQDAEKFITLGHIADYVTVRLNVSESENEQIWTKIESIVIDELAISPRLVQRDARMVEDLGLD